MSEHDDRLAPWRALLLAHSGAVRAIEADLTAGGSISLGWYDVLLELDAAPDRRLRMQQLAARVVLSRTRVSRLVDEIARSGLVERVRDPDDGRATFAVITPAGREALREAAPRYLDAIDQHFTGLFSASEAEQIATLLQRVVDRHAEARGSGAATEALGPRS